MQGNKNVQYYDDDTISIYEVLLIIRKRRWLICIMTFLSLGFFLAYSLVAPNVYKVSNNLVLSQNLSFQYKKNLSSQYKNGSCLFNLQEIKSAMMPLKDLSKKQQAKALGLDKSVVEAIEDIKISEIEGTNSLKVEVDALDGDSGAKMIKALSNFANSFPFIQKRVEAEKELLEKNRDDLKKIIENPLSLLNLPDNTIISEILSSLYDFRKNYNEITCVINELGKGKVVSLAGKTFVPERPYKPRKSMLTAVGFFIGIFTGIFFAFFMEWVASARREYEAR